MPLYRGPPPTRLLVLLEMLSEKTITQRGPVHWHSGSSEAVQIAPHRKGQNAEVARAPVKREKTHCQQDQRTVALILSQPPKPTPRHRVPAQQEQPALLRITVRSPHDVYQREPPRSSGKQSSASRKHIPNCRSETKTRRTSSSPAPQRQALQVRHRACKQPYDANSLTDFCGYFTLSDDWEDSVRGQAALLLL